MRTGATAVPENRHSPVGGPPQLPPAPVRQCVKAVGAIGGGALGTVLWLWASCGAGTRGCGGCTNLSAGDMCERGMPNASASANSSPGLKVYNGEFEYRALTLLVVGDNFMFPTDA